MNGKVNELVGYGRLTGDERNMMRLKSKELQMEDLIHGEKDRD